MSVPQTFQEACLYAVDKYLSSAGQNASLDPGNYVVLIEGILDKIQIHIQSEKTRQRLFGWSQVATWALYSLMNQSKAKLGADELKSAIIYDALQLMFTKQHDYGHGNITKFGEYGVLVRCSDKIARLKNLYKAERAPKNEAILDSWIDIFNYAIIAILCHLNIFMLPYDPDFEWTHEGND